jgi:hypothetical protein
MACPVHTRTTQPCRPGQDWAVPMLMAVLLGACGGGGGGGEAAGNDPGSVAPPAGAEVATASSYLNRVAGGFEPTEFPAGFATYNPYTWGDFAGNGRQDLFSARLTYNTSLPVAQATPAEYRFWQREANGSFTEAPALLATDGVAPCIHPRFAHVADLNRDGRMDVFVACHGYDSAPFPGERNQIVLSQPDGGYKVADASADVGFHHGAALFDFNGDAAPDVLLVNNFDNDRAYVMLNDGNGRFTRSSLYRLPSALRSRQYFTAEILDIDGDGRSDIVIGGHEWENDSRTVVLLNPGNNAFGSVTPIDVPPVAGYGVLLDYAVTVEGGDRFLWLLRTGGDASGLNFYRGTTIQRIRVADRSSTTPLQDRDLAWSQFFLPAVVDGVPVITTPYLPPAFSVRR